MSGRALGLVFTGVLSFIIGITIGSYVFLICAVCMLAVAAISFAATVFALLTVKVSVTCAVNSIERGETAKLRIRSRHFSVIPPGALEFEFENGESLQLGTFPFVLNADGFELCFEHRGMYDPGRGRLRVTDVFNLFTLSKKAHAAGGQLMVLPKKRIGFEAKTVQKDTGETRVRIQDDADEPSAVRYWRDGDLLKRIHWKLTLKNYTAQDGTFKPVVKTYDEEARPDILIVPELSGITATDRRRLIIEDAVCECTYSAAEAYREVSDKAFVLIGNEEIPASDARAALVYARFEGANTFELNVAQIFQRRGRTAAAVFINSRLTYREADALLRLKQASDAVVELIWITDGGINEVNRLAGRLEAGGVHVTVVPPVSE